MLGKDGVVFSLQVFASSRKADKVKYTEHPEANKSSQTAEASGLPTITGAGPEPTQPWLAGRKVFPCKPLIHLDLLFELL